MPHKILIVDDDVLMLEALHDLFAASGYEVTTVSEGQAALEILRKEHFDLLILDVVMPRMTGYDVCVELRRRHDPGREIKVIMLTAKAESRGPKVEECGSDLYLTKPIDPARLLELVESLLNPSTE